MRKSFITVLLLVLIAGIDPLSGQPTYRDHYSQSVDAYKMKEWDRFLDHAAKADSLRPNHPVLLYNLAAAHALNGHNSDAYDMLEKRIDFYAADDFTEDADFQSLHSGARWDSLLARLGRRTKPIKKSRLAFSIELAGFHPEGITYDTQNSRFLLSDIRKGRIFAINTDGSGLNELFRLSDFGYWSALGLAPDPSHPTHLWITTAAIPQFAGYTAEWEGRSALLLVDLETQTLLESHQLEGEHLFGDLITAKDGSLFLTDSMHPTLYRLPADGDTLTSFASRDQWWNLQGLALSADQKTIYLSDYITGIHAVDRATGRSTPLIEDNWKVRGADGIYLMGDTLLFLQNGTRPKRTGRIRIDGQGRGLVTTLDYTDQAIPELNEPTLGVWVDNRLYYIANSPWAHYDSKQAPDLENWPVINIFVLDVK